jgi:hypothetical protein
MCQIGLHRSALRFTMLGISITGALAAPLAFAATSSYDGLYSGTGKVTFGSQPVCGSGGDLSVTVKDGNIDYKFGDFPLKSTISTDGNFRNTVRVGKQGRRTLRTKGTIANAMLEADLRTRDFTGHLCSYHWSLRKQ